MRILRTHESVCESGKTKLSGMNSENKHGKFYQENSIKDFK